MFYTHSAQFYLFINTIIIYVVNNIIDLIKIINFIFFIFFFFLFSIYVCAFEHDTLNAAI